MGREGNAEPLVHVPLENRREREQRTRILVILRRGGREGFFRKEEE